MKPVCHIHSFYNMDGGVAYHRLLSPVRFCWEEMQELGVSLTCDSSLPPDADWIVFHGVPPDMMQFGEIARMKYKGVKIAWSLDDDWLTIPDWNPAKLPEEGRVVFDQMRRMADAIICSTNTLANTFSSCHQPVVVAPNLLDLEIFPKSPYDDAISSGIVDTTVHADEPIRIVWTGSRTHKGDVEIIEDALCRILEKHGPDNGNRAAVIFFGDHLTSSLTRNWLHRGFLWQRAVPFAQYQKIANSMKPDIWLAPLADVQFNHSKSNLRVMEGWALGSAVVASEVGEYNHIRNGVDGVLVRNDDKPTEAATDHWFKTIDQLIQDHQTRISLAANGRHRVMARFDWNDRLNRMPWLKAYCRIAGIEPPKG